MPKPDAFDPLALEVLQQILREQIEDQPQCGFPPEPFKGAGLYALYYVGEFELYQPLVEAEKQVPIYVGKAEAGNSSYGEPVDRERLQLHGRISKHAKSVEEASHNLTLPDFRVRYLPLDDAWIVLGERALLREYRPVLWNTVMPGFGANVPGTDRQNARSVWDTIHPGRPRAGRLCNRRFTLAEQEDRVRRAMDISLMDEGPERQAALEELLRNKLPLIWKPQERGRPILVRDEARFLAEMRRLGEAPPDYVLVGSEVDDLPDPEEQLELNVLSAELAEAGATDEQD